MFAAFARCFASSSRAGQAGNPHSWRCHWG